MPKYAPRPKTYKKRTTRYYAKKKTYSAARKPKSMSRYKRRPQRKTYGRSGGYAKAMQDNTFQYQKKKYTAVFPITAGIGQNSVSTTISIMGGRSLSTPNNTVTIADCDPDGMATDDMKQHQHFKITGMACKLFFPEGTDSESTPQQWSMAYSGSQVIDPNVQFGPIQALSTFQTSSCSATRPITRYFEPNKQLQRLGVDWSTCDAYTAFGSSPPVALYGGQLPITAGSSLWLKVTRSNTAVETKAEIGRLQVTYYITYRGVLGNSSIV